MVKIFIVEDHPIMRQSLRALLERETDLVVGGEAGSGENALEQIDQEIPDLVLIDVSLPGMNGIELAGLLRERYPELPLVMLSGHREKSHVDQAFRAGAHGYILKGHGRELPPAIRQIMRGERYLSSAIRTSEPDGQ
jgi:DNA-binding NarL/FixJ family response regulator